VQRYSAAGQKVGDPFVANRMMRYNQRDAAIAPLQGGGFVLAWISEHRQVLGPPGTSLSGNPQDLALNLMEVYARVFDAAGNPLGDEFLVDQTPLATAAPSVAALADGGFRIAWAQRDLDRSTGWDVFTRAYTAAGMATEAPARVNGYTFGDQYCPRIAALPQGELIVWTSLGQDGAWEGVFGQWISRGQWVGSEFMVNTTTAGRQIQPVVAADGVGGCLAVWASLPDSSGYDLFGQRFVVTQP
jgi:large repetitive protein